MIENCYTAQEWQVIVAASPNPDGDVMLKVRVALETFAKGYADSQVTKKRMARSKLKREQWERIAKVTRVLVQEVDAVDEWYAPLWGSDGEKDFRGERSELVARLNNLSTLAASNIADYDEHAKRFPRRQDPDREQLLQNVLSVWTDELGADLAVSNAGPLWRFFHASVAPILGPKAPRVGGFRTIVEREKRRRKHLRKQADDVLKRKSDFKTA